MPKPPLHALPLHHLDTSVLMEPRSTPTGRDCQRYIQRLAYKYRGQLSLPVLGELMIVLLRESSYTDREDILEWLFDTARIRSLTIYVPTAIGDLTKAIARTDRRLAPTDIQVLACAIEARADTLVTLDEKLLGAERVQQEHRIRVAHPRDFG